MNIYSAGPTIAKTSLQISQVIWIKSIDDTSKDIHSPGPTIANTSLQISQVMWI